MFFDELEPAAARAPARPRRRHATPSRPRACSRRSSRCSTAERPDAGARLRRHQLHARGRARRGAGAVPVAHVEAGMRSFDRTMPEELNRVLTDHASDLLLCSSGDARPRPARRGRRGRVDVVGDVMVDVAQLLAPRARARTAVLERAASSPAATCSPRAPGGQRRRPGAARAPGRAAERAALPGRAAAASAHAGAAGGRGPARPRSSGAGVVARRSATWTSRRCCCTRAVLTDSAACRRRPTWPACRA